MRNIITVPSWRTTNTWRTFNVSGSRRSAGSHCHVIGTSRGSSGCGMRPDSSCGGGGSCCTVSSGSRSFSTAGGSCCSCGRGAGSSLYRLVVACIVHRKWGARWPVNCSLAALASSSSLCSKTISKSSKNSLSTDTFV